MSKSYNLRRDAALLQDPKALAQIGSAIVKSAISRKAADIPITLVASDDKYPGWKVSWVKSPQSGWKDRWSNWTDNWKNKAPKGERALERTRQLLAKVNLDPKKIRLTAAEQKLLTQLDLEYRVVPATATRPKRKRKVS